MRLESRAYLPRHENQVHAVYGDIDDRIIAIAGFVASARNEFEVLFTQIDPECDNIHDEWL